MALRVEGHGESSGATPAAVAQVVAELDGDSFSD